jgi:hypothetical protein
MPLAMRMHSRAAYEAKRPQNEYRKMALNSLPARDGTIRNCDQPGLLDQRKQSVVRLLGPASHTIAATSWLQLFEDATHLRYHTPAHTRRAAAACRSSSWPRKTLQGPHNSSNQVPVSTTDTTSISSDFRWSVTAPRPLLATWVSVKTEASIGGGPQTSGAGGMIGARRPYS